MTKVSPFNFIALGLGLPACLACKRRGKESLLEINSTVVFSSSSLRHLLKAAFNVASAGENAAAAGLNAVAAAATGH